MNLEVRFKNPEAQLINACLFMHCTDYNNSYYAEQQKISESKMP